MFDWSSIGEYANDFAFSSDLLNDDTCLWEYEDRLDQRNHIMLCWRLCLDLSTNELVTDGLDCVVRRDFAFHGTVELGCHYGLEYWRQLKKHH